MKKKRYNKLAFNFLLSVTYFFLFAVQFTGRFYTIANFFVYGSGNGRYAPSTRPSGDIHPESQVFLLVHTKSLPDGLHLSMDKRYHARHLDVAVASSGQFGILPVSKEVRHTFITESSFPVSSSLKNTSLRGPPRA